MRRPLRRPHSTAPSRPTLSDKTVVLTGHDLTVEQVVQVARHGAKVTLSAEARQRSADAHALLLEAAAEGVSVYWFNRGSGSGRERFIFTGDPLSPQNKKLLEERQLAIFRRGALAGLGPEISEEEIVRAMLVVRANTMSFEAASPQLTQRLLDLLNERITPVVQSRSTVGEGDLGPFTNVGAAMVGAGNAYYRGVRMPAAEALKQAGLEPLAPFGADDSELESTNAYATGQAALLLSRCPRGAVMGGPDLRHRPERHEQQRFAAVAAGAGEPAVQMAELGCGPRARHAEGQLSVRLGRRSASSKTRRACVPPRSGRARPGRPGRSCATLC